MATRKKFSPIEERLNQEFDDLEYTVVHLVNQHGQVETAERLGVTQNWVSRFLARHGYTPRTIYSKKKDLSFVPGTMRMQS